MQLEAVTGKRELLLDLMRLARLSSNELCVRQADSALELIPPEGQLSFIWKRKPSGEGSDLPEVIVGSRSSLEDLIAWSTSYIHGLGTLSANCRILLSEEAGLLFQLEEITPPPQLQALAALIIGEMAVLTEPSVPINSLSIIAFKSTFSFVSARSVALKRGSRLRLSEQWQRAHRTLNPVTRVTDLIDPIIQTCNSAIQIIQDQRPEGASTRVGLWLKEIALRGEVEPVILSEVLRLLEQSQYEVMIESFYNLTPADRVRLFDELLPRIRGRQMLPRMERAFAIAVLASACRPGLLQQVSFLRDELSKFHEFLPEAILLLALIQGLHRKNDILEFGEGLGRRIVREVLQREWIIDRPRSDISLIELEVLSKGKSLPSLRTNDPSHINVELQPAISTSVRWNRTSVDQRPLPKDLPFPTTEYDPVEELDKAMRKVSDLWNVVRKDIAPPLSYRKRGTRRH